MGDPDGESSLHNAGVKTLACTQDGEVTIFGDLSTNIDYRALYGAFADVTVTCYVGNENGSDLTLNNQIHGATTLISGEDTGGIERFFLVGDPDAVTEVRGDTDVQILVNVGAEIAVEAVANGKVGLRYDAVETFRTSDEQGADIGMGAEVMHDDQAFYPVGMNVAPEDDTLDTGNLILDLDTVGKMITYNTATARSLNFNNISDTKVGSLWALKVGPSGGTLTGDGGTGVQIRWWNGTGWTTTAAAGNITIGVGDYTIWKETDTLYHISGPTLS